MKDDGDLTIDVFNASGKLERSERTRKLARSEAQWRQQLSEISFLVTRKEATERPFTGKDWDNHMDGLYRCICCDTALFDSRTKFESGTGWPSFWQPLSGNNVAETTDRSFGMVRTSVSCRLCEAHLGHVFADGPKPTGLRYCMNSASMRFVRRA
ncbi:MAG: peptide-methionine (R)-S-oxide reductase MsrB [Herbaspirillum sp.]|nr:peptide-methionine (R)-S-oxide reductase MsrB [Herbaspirillum sp.]